MQIIFSQEYAGFLSEVAVLDEPDSVGGHHEYKIQIFTEKNEANFFINFQKGSAKESGCNGLQTIPLLAVIAHTLKSYQNGPLACHESAMALTNIEKTIACLETRAKDRQKRKVQGIQEK